MYSVVFKSYWPSNRVGEAMPASPLDGEAVHGFACHSLSPAQEQTTHCLHSYTPFLCKQHLPPAMSTVHPPATPHPSYPPRGSPASLPQGQADIRVNIPT